MKQKLMGLALGFYLLFNPIIKANSVSATAGRFLNHVWENKRVAVAIFAGSYLVSSALGIILVVSENTSKAIRRQLIKEHGSLKGEKIANRGAIDSDSDSDSDDATEERETYNREYSRVCRQGEKTLNQSENNLINRFGLFGALSCTTIYLLLKAAKR